MTMDPHCLAAHAIAVKHDRILALKRDGLYVCDVADKNNWAQTDIPLPKGAGVNANTAMVCDPGLDVVVLFSGGNSGPVNIWLMRYVPEKDEEGKQ